MSKITRLLLTILIFYLLRPGGADGDMLYLKDGAEYKGKIEAISQENVSFHSDKTNKIEIFPRSEVIRLEITRKRQGDEAAKLIDLNDELLNSLVKSAPDINEHPLAGYLTLYEEVNLTVDHDSAITETRRVIQKVLQERGIGAVANNIFTYLSKDETMEVDFARTIDSSGNLFHIADNAIEDGSVYNQTPEYENLHRFKFALPEVNVNTITDYRITRRKKKTDVLNPWLLEEYLQSEEPLLKKTVTITLAEGLELQSKVVRPGRTLTETVVPDGKGRKYTWSITDSPRLQPAESNMPPGPDFLPVLTAGLKTTPDETGKIYFNLLEKNLKTSASLKNKISELKDKIKIQPPQSPFIKGEESLARALYDYVAKEIRYIEVPPAEYSYEPKPLDVIFENKAGNSLDKTYLLYGMLKLAGFNPDFLWIRRQSAGELIGEVTSLKQFTTPLAVLKLPALGGGEQTVYLNPSLDTVPFNNLLRDYQGANGFLISAKTTEAIKTPLNETEQESVQNDFEVTLQADGRLAVKKTSRLKGESAVQLRDYKDFKPEELHKEFQGMVNRLHPNARLIDYRISDLKNLDEDVWFTVSYEIKDYALKAGESLLAFKLPEINYSAFEVGRAVRNYPLDWSGRHRESNQMKIIIPDGYRVYYLPAGVGFGRPGKFEYTAALQEEAKQIIFNDHYTRETTALPAAEYAEYKQCVETKASLAKEWLVLEKIQEKK